MKDTMKIHLLAIVCQNDFAANGSNSNGYKGTLYVQGADKDMENLANFINRMGNKINRIFATMDSHHIMQIFHPAFWVDSNGNHPAPFTVISVEDVKKGIWRTSIPQLATKARGYVEKLAAKGKYPLICWPEHVLIGGRGNNIVPCVDEALKTWARNRKGWVDYCVKGDFYLSEHYGALAAEVEYPEEPSTMLNTKLIQSLQEADVLLIAGEALSHCVKSTVEQVAEAFGDDNIKKFVLLEDCCSSVNGFEKLGSDFVDKMTKRGMKLSKSTEYLR